MAAEEGDGFDPQACNLAEFCRRTGLTCSRARTVRAHGFRALPHGNSGRRAAPGRACRPHRPGGRPPAEGRHQLAGDIRAAARPGLRRRPHHGEDLYRRVPGPRAREEGGRWPRRSCRGQRFQDGARRGLPDGLGLRRGRAPRRRAGADRLLRHGLPPLRERPVEFFPNARQENLLIGMLHAFSALGVPATVLTDNMKSVVVRRDADGRPVWQADYAEFMGVVGFRTRLCRPRHLYEGQGGEARPFREGELPRGKVLHRP